eukprot:g4344.t1
MARSRSHHLLLFVLLVVFLSTTFSVNVERRDAASTQGMLQTSLRTSHKVSLSTSLEKQKHYDTLSASLGLSEGILKRLVDGATSAFSGISRSFARLSQKFGEFKDQTKYLLNMLQLKKPGGYTQAFCKHSEDDCETVDNYPWPRSHTELTHEKVVEGLESVAGKQRNGDIFRGNELGYLILNNALWTSFEEDGGDTRTIGLGMTVAEHEEIRPVLDKILGHGSSAWSKSMVEEAAAAFFQYSEDPSDVFATSATSLARPQMKQTKSNMIKTCNEMSGWAWGASTKCEQCAQFEFCESKYSKKLGFIPRCSCAFDEIKAEAALRKRAAAEAAESPATNGAPREVIRVQKDVKIWSTKLLHKVHLNMDLTDMEASKFVDVQSTCLVATILPQGLVNKVKFVSKIDEVKAYRKEMILRYQQAIRDDSRGIVPEVFKSDEQKNFLLASNVLDSLLFAGGLSVPSVIGVSLAVLFAGENSPMSRADREQLTSTFESDPMVVAKFVFETTRRYPPVVGFPWWDDETKSNFRTVMNLAMAQRDPRVWGDDAESFKLRSTSAYARLMGVGWAAPHTDWTEADGWTSSTGVRDYGGMARECPAKELSHVMATAFVRAFLNNEKETGKFWRVQNNQVVQLTESTPFHNEFTLIRGVVEDLGQCDTTACELFVVSKHEIDKEMLPAAVDSGIPLSLQGLFWMEGNPAPDDIASFGGSTWAFNDFDGVDEASVDAEISVYGNRVWSWHDNKLGRATYKKAAMSKLTYNFHCNEAVDHCLITISTKRRFMGGVGKILSGVADFTMDRCTDEMIRGDGDPIEGMERCRDAPSSTGVVWIRKSKIFGGILPEHQYLLRQIVDGAGARVPGAWDRFIDTVDDNLLLARAKNDETFEEWIKKEEEGIRKEAFGDATRALMGDELKRIKPGQNGCRVDVECATTRKCFDGRCQALLGQVSDAARCRLDGECRSGKCQDNRFGWKDGTCAGLGFGVEAPEVSSKCKTEGNPSTCTSCVAATHEDDGTACSWCAAFHSDVGRGQCVKSASHCPKGATYYASRQRPFNLDRQSPETDGLTWRTGAEVVPFDITGDRVDSCRVPGDANSRYEALQHFFPIEAGNIQKLLAYKYATLDFFARSNYAALVSAYHAWMDALPTSSGSVRNFDPPGSFSDKLLQPFAGIKICTHDEDWIPVTAREKRLTKIITKIPEGWGRANLFMHKSQDTKYFTYYWDGTDPNNEGKSAAKLLDWGLGPLSTAPGGQSKLLLESPLAKPSIFESGRSAGWKQKGVDAESQAMVEEYFGKLFPQPLAEYTVEKVLSDQGLTDIFFDGPAVVFTRHVESEAARNNHAGGFGGGNNAMLFLEVEEEENLLLSNRLDHPEDAVYVADLSYMSKFKVRKCPKKDKSCSPFVRYGFVLHFDADRRPIQISTKHLGVSTPDDEKWEAAKFAVRVSAIAEITAIDHLLYSHLTVSNGGTRAALEKLDTEHPLRRLLKPFTYRANKINDQASRALFIRGGLVDRTFAFDPDAVGSYFDEMSKNFKFRTVPDFIREIGIDVSKSTVLADMERLWVVQRSYTSDFVSLHFESDDDVTSDALVVAYWNFLESEARTYSYGLPELSKEALIDQITHHMFWVTGMHKLVGNVADWLRTGARGFPTVMRENGKLEADIQYFFVASTIAGFTGMPQVNLINSWNHLYDSEEEVAAGKKWQDALRELASNIDTDNQGRSFPSNYLNPRFLDSSVAI